MELFDTINLLFKPKEWNKSSPSDWSKHFFMINRFCSIQYPVQCSMLNNIKINSTNGIRILQKLLSKQYTKTPNWMYTKVTKTEKIKRKDFADELIMQYCKAYRISKREFFENLEFFGKEFEKNVEQFKKLL